MTQCGPLFSRKVERLRLRTLLIVDRASQQQLEAGGSDGAAAVAAGGAGGGAGHRHQHPHVPPHPRHAQHCQGQVQVGFGV